MLTNGFGLVMDTEDNVKDAKMLVEENNKKTSSTNILNLKDIEIFRC